MANKLPKTIVDHVIDRLQVNYRSKIALRRSYDNWMLKQIWENKKRTMLCKNQKLKIGTHEELGPDLAVSRFVIGYCHGQVRDGQNKWLTKYFDLPETYEDSFKISAIRVNKSKLLTEGIDNFVGIDHIEFLDLSENTMLDDFACDQLARQFRHSKTLREINLSYNPLISIGGLDVLFRIPSLKRLVAMETQASYQEEIDLFTLSAEDERQCEVVAHKDGRRFLHPELEKLGCISSQ